MESDEPKLEKSLKERGWIQRFRPELSKDYGRLDPRNQYSGQPIWRKLLLEMKRKSSKSSARKPKLSLSGVPMIPKDEPISWEDWMAGRKQRRKTGMLVAPEIIRRETSSGDKRLRALYNGERGLPFTPTEELPGWDV